MSTPSGKAVVLARHCSAKPPGSVQAKAASSGMPGPDARRERPCPKVEPGKADGGGTVGIGGQALREGGEGRQFRGAAHQCEGRFFGLLHKRAPALEAQPRQHVVAPQAGGQPDRGFAVTEGQGDARQHGRKRFRQAFRKDGEGTGPRGTGHGFQHGAENPLRVEHGMSESLHQSSPRTSVKKSTRVGSTAAASARTRAARSASRTGSSSRSRRSA